MPVSWLDFIYLGPTSIWVLAGMILFSALALFRFTKMITFELRNTTSELKRGATELERITSELRKDTADLVRGISELKQTNIELKQGMDTTNNTIEDFNQPLRRFAAIWFPRFNE